MLTRQTQERKATNDEAEKVLISLQERSDSLAKQLAAQKKQLDQLETQKKEAECNASWAYAKM